MESKKRKKIAGLEWITTHQPTRSAFLNITLLALLFCAMAPRASGQWKSSPAAANSRVCFTQVTGVPQPDGHGGFIFPRTPPVIDGVVAGDTGWTSSFRYVFSTGTPTPDVAVQGIKDNNFVYLSFEVNNDKTYDDNDVIVLTFSPDGTAANDQRLQIFPNFANTQKPSGSDPRDVGYWTNSGTWDTGSARSAIPAGTVIKMSDSGDPNSGNVSWFVEMKLPIAGFNFPAAGDFGFYFNVLSGTRSNNTTPEYFWPPISGGLIVGLLDNNTPGQANWGNGTRDPGKSCLGVNFDWYDITSNHNQDQVDAASVPNNNAFTALLHNSSVDPTGVPVTASQVTAAFSIADFGLACSTCASWTKIPVPKNPTDPLDITAGGTQSYTSSPGWNITDPSEIAAYKAIPDQCILVDLDSKALNTFFVNKSARRNMMVQTASEVTKTPVINARGFSDPPAGKAEQEFDLHIVSHQEVLKPGESVPGHTIPSSATTPAGGGNRNRVFSHLTWVAHGCRRTGLFVTIGQDKWEICEPAGAFGYSILHAGVNAVDHWDISLDGGPNLNKTGNDYHVRVRKDGVLKLNQRIAPIEKKKGCFDRVPNAGATFIFLGVFVVGLVVYRSRTTRTDDDAENA